MSWIDADADPALVVALDSPRDEAILGKAPIKVVLPIPDRDAVQGQDFAFRLPDGTFAAPTGIFTYFAQLADGSQLPDWLTFDPASQTFEGTPPSDFTGVLDVRVWAYDPAFDEIYEDFALRIRTSDDAPTAKPVADRAILEDSGSWTFKVPKGTFADDDSTGLVYHAALAGGMPLPAWVTFDSRTLTFSGTPPHNFFGTLVFVITADDGAYAATTSFSLTVTGTPDPPEVQIAPQDHYAVEDTPILFSLPMSTFDDPDGDALTYTALLANGQALPDWLHFDPATLTFSGTPPLNFNGAVSVEVIASDGLFHTPTTFDIEIEPVNDPPTLAKPLPDQHLKPGAAFTYTIGAKAFVDVDNPTLTYSATQANGHALPSWLHFDSATRTFSGTAPGGFVKPIYVIVTASDGQASASDSFVFGGNAPFAETAIPDQTIGQGAWHYTVPIDSFRDFDTPHLTYSVTLADGEALPSWVSFDAATQTFSGTPPTDWDGREDFAVTASDGKHSATEDFAVIKNGDLSWNLSGSFWGENAPTEINYRFDKLYFQTSNDWSAGFDAGFSSGPVYGGVSGNVGFAYAMQAGLLLDVTIKPDTFALQEGINIHEQLSAPATDGSAPWVIVTGQMDAHTSLTGSSPSDAFYLHAFAGITASASANIGGSIYGGFETPDIDLGPFGSIDVPDITFSAGFNQNISFPGIQPITIGDGSFNNPGDAGAIDVTIKSGDQPFTFDLDDDGIGHISIAPPSGINLSSYDVEDVGASGLGTLHIGGTSAPIVSAQLDLDALAVHIVPELEPLFHDKLDYDLGGFHVGAQIDSDFGLTGSIAYKEDLYFTPQLYSDFSTVFADPRYDETITHVAAGTQQLFDTPEGEGTFTVNVRDYTEADVRAVISLVASISFDYSLLKSTLSASVGEGPISYTIGDISISPVFSGSVSFINATFPVWSNTDHYTLDQVHTDSFVMSYEKFRTVDGSGDDFTLTTHQIYAYGNLDDNHLIGNLLGNSIYGSGGNDTLDGLAGDDTLDGGDDNDTLLGGPGHDSLFGDAGDDHLTAGDDGSTINGGDGNDVIVSGFGVDQIIDMFGIVNITDSGGDNVITVGDGGGHITVLAGGNQITAGAGDDVITTGAGNDQIHAGDGANVVDAGDGGNLVYGGAQADHLTTGAGNDTVAGFDGNDVLSLGDGADDGEGGSGNDRIDGGAGDDSLLGDDGNDQLTGGLGADELDGSTGRNIFIYTSAAESNSASMDTLVRFQGGTDRIDLPFAVTGIDKTRAGAVSSATLDHDLGAILAGTKLGQDHAVLVTANGGSYNGYSFLVIDGNHQAGYQPGQDYVMLLAAPVSTHIDLHTFI